jgi:hypothetical protein
MGVRILLKYLEATLPSSVKKMVEAVLGASGCPCGQDRR